MQKVISRLTFLRSIVLTMISLSIFIFLFKTYSIQWSQIVPTSYFYLGLSILVTATFPPLSSLRWKWVLEAMSVDIKFRHALRITIATWIFSIIPGRVGDFMKGVAIPQAKKEFAFGSVAFEKIVDVFSLLFISTAGLFMVGKNLSALILVIMCICILTCLIYARRLLFLLPLRMRDRLDSLHQVMVQIFKTPAHIIKIFCASLANWLFSMVQVFLLFRAFDGTVSMVYVLAFLPISIFVGLIPVSLAGMGTRDSAIVVLFVGLATTSQSVAVGIWYSLLGYWAPAIIGLFFTPSLMSAERE